jgi:pre-mRNA-splicing factor CWC26
MTKTLDGKSAGLQSAKSVRAENETFRQREKQMFDSMAAPDSSRVVMRDRKTGRIRDFEAERRREAEKQHELDKRKEVYDKWGRGVKQTEAYNSRLAEHAHEMNKPLARHADDTDLEEHLKKQERLGDPMLEYLRQKEKQQQRKAGVPERPVYKGIVPDNRFNIRPGYRWDGVDRSNGYEQKWFETQSKKEASKEEIYKYSVEDM